MPDRAVHRGWALPLLLCLALLPRAAAACQPLEAEPLEQSLVRVAECQDQPSWLAWVGERLNRAGRYAEAVDHLERALLLDPDLLPARLGYLLALAGSGDIEAALAFARDLLAQGDLPPAVSGPLAQRVERWRRELQTPPAPLATSRTRLSAGLRVGHDSNLLGAPNLDSLTLILAGQPVELPLDDSYRSRPGSYVRLDGNLEHARLLDELAPGMRLDMVLQLRRRLSAAVPQSNLDQVNLALELSRRWSGVTAPGKAPPPLAGWYGSLSAGSLDGAIGTRYRTMGIGGGLQWQLRPADSACEARTGLDAQQRHLASNTVLSGNYAGVQLLLQCELPGLGVQPVPGGMPAAPVWQLALTRGTDRPSDGARPGGAQRQSLVRLSGFYGPWLADLDLERRQDALIYSALLGDETREVLRRAARIEWRGFGLPAWLAPAAPGQGGSVELRLGVEWSVQRATIGLFNARSWGPYAALRYLW